MNNSNMGDESYDDNNNNVTSSNSSMHSLLMLSPSYTTHLHHLHLSQILMMDDDVVVDGGGVGDTPSRLRNPPYSLINEMFLLLVERINTIQDSSTTTTTTDEDGNMLPPFHSPLGPSQRQRQQLTGRGRRLQYSTNSERPTDIISEALAIIENVE